VRVLLDEHLPLDLARELQGHDVQTVVGRGWAGVKNGDLLRLMRDDYDTFLTGARVARCGPALEAKYDSCVASLSRLADCGDGKPVSATEMAAVDAGLLLPSRPLARAC
jgi:hypothetical protein